MTGGDQIVSAIGTAHDWKQVPIDPDPTIPGYFQLFNAESRWISSVRS
jgi:hypothetical protein